MSRRLRYLHALLALLCSSCFTCLVAAALLTYFVAAALLTLGVPVPAGMRAGAQRDKQEQEKSKRGKPAESVLQVCALTLQVHAPLMLRSASRGSFEGLIH